MAVTGLVLGSRLIEVLGLPDNVIWFELRCAVDEPVTIRCQYYPSLEPNAQGELETILAEYELVEKGPDDRT